MRTISVLLTGLLVVAAVGRFSAEAEVRERQRELADVRSVIRGLEREIAAVQLDVEVLESAGRLIELNQSYINLDTVQAEQLVDRRAFASLLGRTVPADMPAVPAEVDVIGNAIGMAELAWLDSQPAVEGAH